MTQPTWSVEEASFRKNILYPFQMLLQGGSCFGGLAAPNCCRDPTVIRGSVGCFTTPGNVLDIWFAI
jgi:hypothetical protein